MSEYTFTGTITVDGVVHQVSADGTLTPVTPPASTGSGTGTTTGTGTGTGTGTSSGGGSTTPPSPPPPPCLFGIWDPGDVSWTGPNGNPLGQTNGAAAFSAAPVKSLTYYTGWLGPLPPTMITAAQSIGASVYLNLEPWHTWGNQPDPTMADIARGVYDSYLTSIGAAIKAGGQLTYVTFAHEQNGTWYPWGIQAVSPQQWIQTWQHVCDVIRAAAGGLAKMVWAPNNNDVGPVTPYWPGAAYVDVPAFDGYLHGTTPEQTYASFIKPTVDEIRTLAGNVPVWNAETGVSSGADRITRYPQFIADMHADNLLGFSQFNEGDWALSTAEIAAVTAAVNAWNAA